MRILIGMFLVNRQIQRQFRQEGRGFRFFPAGTMLPSLRVDRRQRRRIEERMPTVYAQLMLAAIAGNLSMVGGLILWDRIVGYVDALEALGLFGAAFAAFAAILHIWLYASLRQVIRST